MVSKTSELAFDSVINCTNSKLILYSNLKLIAYLYMYCIYCLVEIFIVLVGNLS